MSGQFASMNTKMISTQKSKGLAKLNNLSLNELFMAMLSTCLKEYFDTKGDTSDQISLIIPFTFRATPRKIKDYAIGNDHSTLPIYLKL